MMDVIQHGKNLRGTQFKGVLLLQNLGDVQKFQYPVYSMER